MLKGLALTPPVLGRISIGKIIERNGKRLPEKDDEFTITTQVQSKNSWILHPLDQQLRQADTTSKTKESATKAQTKAPAKLRQIPIYLLFDDPDLNLRAQYSLFDRSRGRPLCVGNGEDCKRVMNGQLEAHPCPGPDICPLGAHNQCKPYGRMNVRIGDDDELGTFVLRTTGFNSIRTLSARLRYYHAVSNGQLSTLPLELRLRSKSTTQSHRAPIYYVDLVIRTGLTLNEAITQATETYQQRQQAGFNQTALDEAAKQGFAAGAFEEREEDGLAVVEEFYPDSTECLDNTQSGAVPANDSTIVDKETEAENQAKSPLARELTQKSAQIAR